MYENKRRRKFTRRPVFNVKKYLLMLSCFALVYNPFSSLGDLAYAESEQSNDQIVDDIEQESEVEGSDAEELESAEDTEISEEEEKGEFSDKNKADEALEEGLNLLDTGDEKEDSSD